MVAEIKIPPILKIGGGSFATVAALLLRLRVQAALDCDRSFPDEESACGKLGHTDTRCGTEL